MALSTIFICVIRPALAQTGTTASSTAISQNGSAGNYTLTATVTGATGKAAPTGKVSFLDTSNGNAQLGIATLATASSSGSAWSTSQTPGVCTAPVSIAIGDFNSDGIPDLAVGCATNISVLIGNGNGTFKAASNIPITLYGSATTSLQSIAVASFNTNNNSYPGIFAITNNPSASLNGIEILNNGNANFTVEAPFSLPFGSVFALNIGDLNSDGKQDFLISGASGGVSYFSYFLGNGNGTFGSPTSIALPLGTTIFAITLGDFNGDGSTDVAVVTSSTSTGAYQVTVYLNNGTGTFSAGPTTLVPGTTPSAVVAGKFNADTKLDLAITDSGTGKVSILLGTGTGAFTVGAVQPATGKTPVSITTGDFNGDGFADLATANSGDNSVTVLLGNGDGTFTTSTSTPTPGKGPVSIVAGLFSGTALPGVAVANSTDGTATIALSQGLPTSTATVTGISPSGSGAHLVEASYPGDTIYAASVSGTTSLSSATVSTSLLLSANPTSSLLGQQVVLTATLTPYSSGANTTNSESISFYNGSTSIGVGALSSGVATLTISSLPAGTLSLSAKYAGDTNFVGSTSNTLSFVVAAPAVSLSSSGLTFASQLTGTTSAAQPVVLTNTGTATLTITSITASSPFTQTNNCGGSVAAGAPCTVSVSFAPTVAGNPTGTLTFIDNAANSPQSIPLSGTAANAAPAVTLSTSGLIFASQTVGTTSTAQTVMISNTGTGALTITSIAASGDFAQTNNCSSVAAGSNCMISVTFTPTASGTRTGSITITDNATGSPHTVTLTGTGTVVPVSVTPTSPSLSISSVGGSATDTLQIAATGGYSGSVNLSCQVTYQGTGQSYDLPKCSMSPLQVQVTSGSPSSTTLTVATTASTARTSRPSLPWLPTSSVALAALLVLVWSPRRRRWTANLLLLLALAALWSGTGCGHTVPDPGTTPGPYQVVVTATTSTAVTVSTLLPLTLQ